ncbi:D-alanyl-D-alanine carboxypeptidase/D-alanyl-D-alanine-endopeptidase (penicillin-binding protein 4) [Dysgonomonadaceae bacterium PH5-43]|nr:D-alanyl-D-alanine carboxypeptidase/D-alanyl-D-alanine-endopeptidase (penicillin-binding protein 4) [Dysgonomonadaceae bacterium PH5-43]
MKSKLFIVILYVCLISFNVAYTQTASVKLDKFLQSPNLKHSAISFELINISSGKIVSEYNSDMSLKPASINKIITTATALEVLGSDYTYKTSLFYDGTIRNSLLNGNLYIEGSGDPTLGSEFISKNKEAFLLEYLKAMRSLGIKQIKGDIVILDQLFGYNGIPNKWLLEDIGNYYASGTYGISIFDNMYRLYLRSAQPRSRVKVLKTLPVMDLVYDNQMIAGSTNADRSLITGMPFSRERRLTGSIPPNKKEYIIKGDIPDPGLFLASYFKSFLEKNNIKVMGKATTYRLNKINATNKTKIAEIESPDIATISRVINVRSNNHYAEHLYKLLISKKVNIVNHWKSKGLDSSSLFIYDGCGLSPCDAVSASFMNKILTYMYNSKNKEAFYNSLPLAGKEGTVVSFLKNSKLEGKARVKSGSIANVCSYSGYIEHEDNIYAFTIIINNFTGTRSQLRDDIKALLVGLL